MMQKSEENITAAMLSDAISPESGSTHHHKFFQLDHSARSIEVAILHSKLKQSTCVVIQGGPSDITLIPN